MISDPNSISRIATGDHVDHSFFCFEKMAAEPKTSRNSHYKNS